MAKKFLTVIALFIIGTAYSQSLKEARVFTQNEQFEKASAAYKKLIAAEPQNGDNYFYYGENYFKTDNLDSAKYFYQKGIEVNATNALNYAGLGKVYLFQKNVTDANKNFFTAKTLSQSKNATVLMKIAEAEIKADLKNLDDANLLLKQAAKLEPNNPEIYILMGDAALEQNRSMGGGEAIKNYEKASSLDKKSVKAILRTGQLWAAAANYTLALEQYQKALKIDSTYAPAYRERAEIYYKARRYKEAISSYEKYLLLNNDQSARIRYAQFLFLSNQYQNAVNEINTIQKTDTNNIILYRLLGYSLFELGKEAPATEKNKYYSEGMININKFFDKAQKKNTKILASDYEYQGKLYAETGKDSIGVMMITKALEMDTSNTELYNDIASIYTKQKKHKEAATYLEKKIKSGKGVNINDYNKLGKAYYLSKEYVKADSAFIKVIEGQPTLGVGYLWRAKSNSQLDPDSKQGLAKPYYEQFIEKAQTDVEKNKKDLIEAYSYLGFYYLLKKDYANSKTNWLKVKELDPNNDKAKAALSDPKMK